MKYIVLIGDGMADRPIAELGGLTPLQKANTPNMDRLAVMGISGISRTIPPGFPPGSDVANLSILGYDPAKYYSGRAPLEAASIGVKLEDGDVAYRCNLVTLDIKEDLATTVMDDYSSGHITTEEANLLINAVQSKIGSEDVKFYPGVSYRHLMVWKNGKCDAQCTPPHDILGKEIGAYLPNGDGAGFLRELTIGSIDLLKSHPVNQERIAKGKKPANSIWLWGQGKRPQMPTYLERFGIKGALISAVDLTKGLGIYAGFEVLKVPGATGWLDTNYIGKADYALNALNNVDFVYVHVESPDEAGHSGNYKDKIRAIEDFDELVVGRIMKGLEDRFKDYRVLLMPDHATPIELRTHSEEPVPFVLYDSRYVKNNNGAVYNESITSRPDVLNFEEGYKLMEFFIKI
jgi:2,3-bisphosphoglycerate-independent phosphoglycerate mutase